MRHIHYLLTLFVPALMLVTACSGPPEEAPLKGATIGGAFTLVDQDGQQVSYSDFDGQYRIMYFGYSYCPDVCPVDLQKLAQGFAAFEKAYPERAKNIQPIFVTIDPERDTPEVMKNYVAAFHPRLIGLTGSEEQIKETARKFAIYRAKREQEGFAEYLMDHSRQTYLFDAAGKPLALLPVDNNEDGSPSTPEDIAAALDKWGPPAGDM